VLKPVDIGQPQPGRRIGRTSRDQLFGQVGRLLNVGLRRGGRSQQTVGLGVQSVQGQGARYAKLAAEREAERAEGRPSLVGWSSIR